MGSAAGTADATGRAFLGGTRGPYNLVIAAAGAFLICMALFFLRTIWRR